MFILKQQHACWDFIGDLFSSDNGSGYKAGGTPILTPSNLVANADQTYGQAQSGLSQQQAFVDALNAQNGIGNQSQVFAQQQALANQLQGVANGTGPNPALAQLNQTTGNNIASQAALIAGQRGAGANVGLLARQAAMQGGNLQQQAVGQGATMQAQQQLAAMQALQGQQAQMAGLATNQVGQQAQALGGYNQYAQGLAGQQQAAIAEQNKQNVAMQSSVNAANAGVANQNAKAQEGFLGDAFGALSSAPMGGLKSGLGMADGGRVPAGSAPVPGDSPANDTVPAMLSPNEIVIPRSIVMGPNAPAEAAKFVAQQLAAHHTKMAKHYASGGMVAGEEALLQQRIAQKKSQLGSMPQALGPSSPGGSIDQQAADLAAGDIAREREFKQVRDNAAVEGFRNSLQQEPRAAVAQELAYGNGPSPALKRIENADAQLAPEGMPTMGEQGMPADGAPTMQNAPSAIAKPASGAGAVGRLKGAIRGEASAIGELGQATARVDQSLQYGLQNVARNYEEKKTDLATKQNMLMDEVKATRIDPSRLMANQSTGQKVLTSIGLILGGMGAHTRNGRNPAMEYLNKQIDDDVSAQKANLDNKNTMIGQYMKMGMSLTEAEGSAKVGMMQMAKIKLEQLSAASQDPQARARAEQAIAKIDMQIGALNSQTAAKAAAFANPNMPIEQKINYLPQHDQDNARKEINGVRAYHKSSKEIADIYEEAKKLSSVWSSVPGTAQSAKLDVLNARLQQKIRMGAKGSGTFTDSDEKALIIPYAIGMKDLLNPSRLDEKLPGLIDGMGQKVMGGNQTLDQYGLKLDATPSTLSSEKQKMLNWAQSNMKGPNAAKAKAMMARLGK